MSNFDKLLSDAKAKALACVGTTGFTHDNDTIITLFGELESVMLSVKQVAAAQAEAEAEAKANAAEEWFSLVDNTFKACPHRFLWRRGKAVLMVVVSEKNTSDAAEIEFTQWLAPLGDITRHLDSQTMGNTEVFYTSVELKGLDLIRNLDATEHGGITKKVTAGLTRVMAED